VTEPVPATHGELTLPAAPPSISSPYLVFLARFQAGSRRTMQGCLDRIAGIILGVSPVPGLGEATGWHRLSYSHVVFLRGRFAEQWPAPSYVNLHLSALRGVLKEAWKLGLMDPEEYHRARTVENVRGSRLPAGRDIRDDELTAMLTACLTDDGGEDADDQTRERAIIRGRRDAAIIAVLASTGARRMEIAQAELPDYDHRERALRVIGKGNKQRLVFLHKGAVLYFDLWLVIVGERTGPIFRRIDRWGHISPKPLHPSSIGYIVNQRRTQADLPVLSPHDFRRKFIGDFLDAGGDLAQAQRLAGHALPSTTAGYDRRPDRALRAAVDKLSLPAPDALAGPQ
jgi:integrase